MNFFRKSIMSFVLLDNVLTNLPKKFIFKSRYRREGKCKQCGVCCKEIYLKITPAQIRSRFFTRLAVWWIEWLFEFNLLRIDRERLYLIFNCKNQKEDGHCGNYFWRPNICRNFPLVDYFDEPVFLPGCGFNARLRVGKKLFN